MSNTAGTRNTHTHTHTCFLEDDGICVGDGLLWEVVKKNPKKVTVADTLGCLTSSGTAQKSPPHLCPSGRNPCAQASCACLRAALALIESPRSPGVHIPSRRTHTRRQTRLRAHGRLIQLPDVAVELDLMEFLQNVSREHIQQQHGFSGLQCHSRYTSL